MVTFHATKYGHRREEEVDSQRGQGREQAETMEEM